MRACVAAVFLFACASGGTTPPNEPKADRPAAVINEAVAMFMDMAKVVVSSRDDCERMAREVGHWLHTNGAKRKRIYAVLVQIDSPATNEAYRQGLSQHVETLIEMKTGVEGCQTHAGFVRAWNRLDNR